MLGRRRAQNPVDGQFEVEDELHTAVAGRLVCHLADGALEAALRTARPHRGRARAKAVKKLIREPMPLTEHAEAQEFRQRLIRGAPWAVEGARCPLVLPPRTPPAHRGQLMGRTAREANITSATDAGTLESPGCEGEVPPHLSREQRCSGACLESFASWGRRWTGPLNDESGMSKNRSHPGHVVLPLEPGGRLQG